MTLPFYFVNLDCLFWWIIATIPNIYDSLKQDACVK